MAYATTNPPSLTTMGPLTGSAGGRMWSYVSADASATVDASGYITNGGNLGMKVGDLVVCFDTVNKIASSHYVVTVSSTAPGAVDLSNGTVIGSGTNSD